MDNRKMPPQKSPKQLQAICDRFNAKHPVGTLGLLREDFKDNPTPTRTRTVAQVLSGHTPVVWLEGISGCYLLDRFTPDASAKPEPRPPLLGSGPPTP